MRIKCSVCKGAGKVQFKKQNIKPRYISCSICKGTGMVEIKEQGGILNIGSDT